MQSVVVMQEYHRLYRPTPYSLGVAALMALHGGCDSISSNNPLYYARENDAAKVDAFLQSLRLLQNNENDNTALFSLYDVPLATLAQQLSVAVSPEIAHQWKGWLLTAANTLDAFCDLASTLQIAVRDGRVDPHSQNGMFLRQIVLGWEELPFEGVVALWKDFQKELMQEEEEPEESKDSNTGSSYQQEWTRSSQQMEQSIRTVVMSMAQQQSHHLGANQQQEIMQEQLETVLQHHPELPAAHFLKFLLGLQTGERVGAMEALHRYMDYALANEQLQQQHPTAAASSSSSLPLPFCRWHPFCAPCCTRNWANPRPSFERPWPKPCAWRSSSSHHHQSNDATATTALALGWWAQTATSAEQPPSSWQSSSASSTTTAALWQRCVERARPHPELRALQAGAGLALAARTHDWRHLQAATADEDPAAAASSSGNNSHHRHYDDRPCSAQLGSGRAAAAILARQRLVAAGLWSHRGQHVLSAHASATALSSSTASSGGSGNDLSRHECAVAIQNLGKSCLRWLGNDQEDTTTTDNCIYANALRTFVSLREAYQLPVDGVFLFDVALVLHEWAVRRGRLDESEALMAAMESHLHPRIDNYAEIVLDMCSQKALLRSRQGKSAEARQLLSEQIAKCRAAGQHDHTARLLLQLSMVQLAEHRPVVAVVLRVLSNNNNNDSPPSCRRCWNA